MEAWHTFVFHGFPGFGTEGDDLGISLLGHQSREMGTGTGTPGVAGCHCPIRLSLGEKGRRRNTNR